jgi:serine/threonine-protein kinase RsbW
VTETEPPTKVSIAAGPLVGPVLRRVVGMFAARADLPLDRLDDAVLVADVVAARAPAHVTDTTVDVALASSTPRCRASAT